MNLGRDEKPVAAIATAPGAAGVAAIRISGAGSFAVLDKLIKPRDYCAGTFFFARFHHPGTGEFIDSGVVLIFKAPASYTGEDTVELQCHGGARQPERLLRAVLAAGAEQAGPGEFTRRAFLNGRMDLTQAEAVADLIHAQSERAAKAAGLQLDGSLGREIGTLYDGLTDWCAALEHALDFEEGELPDLFHPGLIETAGRLHAEILRIAGSFREGRLLREGALAVICGKPNTGKSSLFNALLGHRRAIVHAQAGTTRDSIEESLIVCGIPLRLTDTAGLRETACEIEHEGVVLAHRTIAAADLIVYLVDVSVGLDPEEKAFLSTLAPEQLLLVYSKTDLASAPEGAFGISLASDAGIRAAVSGLHRALEQKLNLDKSAPVAAGVSQRHHQELILAAEQLESARKLLADSPDFLVPAAEHAKNAAEAVGRILGRTYSEDLLERVFSRFCVGK